MEIIKYPNKILQTKTQNVEKIDDEILGLIRNLFETLHKSKRPGVGLAAPQVGISLNLTVIGFEPTEQEMKEEKDLKPVPVTVLINPKTTWLSKETVIDKEGCLSVDNTVIDVPRFQKIHIEYIDENGKRQKLKAKNYIARVLQHEIDHLQGKLIVDYKKSKS